MTEEIIEDAPVVEPTHGDLYLKFADEVEAIDILYGEVPAEWNEDGEPTAWTMQPNYANIDTLGVLYERQEVTDPDNPPEPVAIPGWHVNVRVVGGEDAEALQEYAVIPTNPRRIWA